jgi:hypothetical protein
MDITQPFNVLDWAKTIKDNHSHHIGEYYFHMTGDEWYHISRGFTAGFIGWVRCQDLGKMIRLLSSNGFEVRRDLGNRTGFFVRRK